MTDQKRADEINEEVERQKAEKWIEGEKRWAKIRDDGLVARFQKCEELAGRMLSHDGAREFDPVEARRLALDLVLLEYSYSGISPFHRFRSRYAGSY